MCEKRKRKKGKKECVFAVKIIESNKKSNKKMNKENNIFIYFRKN